MMSRINDWAPLGSTGYPLALGMYVEAGINKCRTGSAVHCCRTSSSDGMGGVRSRAIIAVNKPANQEAIPHTEGQARIIITHGADGVPHFPSDDRGSNRKQC